MSTQETSTPTQETSTSVDSTDKLDKQIHRVGVSVTVYSAVYSPCRFHSDFSGTMSHCATCVAGNARASWTAVRPTCLYEVLPGLSSSNWSRSQKQVVAEHFLHGPQYSLSVF